MRELKTRDLDYLLLALRPPKLRMDGRPWLAPRVEALGRERAAAAKTSMRRDFGVVGKRRRGALQGPVSEAGPRWDREDDTSADGAEGGAGQGDHWSA